MKNVLVVLNPDAGRKRAIKYKKAIMHFLFRCAEKFKFVSVDEFSEASAAEFDTVIVVGGDGTINKVLPAVIEGQKALGIVPSGTANLFSAKLGIPTNLKKALEIIKTECVKPVDVLKVDDRYCALRLGFGYDADIICKTPQSLKNNFGYFAYFVAGILFALRLRGKEYSITLNDESLTVNASCIIVANAANMYRNIVSVAKGCKLDDGLADVFILKTTNPVIFFFELVKMFFNLHKTNKNAMYYKVKKLSISNKWMNAHLDGEKKNFKENVHVDVESSVLNVICAK